MTHTKGEWHEHDGQIYPEETGKTICLLPYYDKENEEHKANARLIAASPKLLEALEMAVKWLDGIRAINYDLYMEGQPDDVGRAFIREALAAAEK